MRGKVWRSSLLSPATGITPAYAGKSFALLYLSGLLPGSPPPMRGKAENACVTDAGNRITPAYAGKSAKSANRGNEC